MKKKAAVVLTAASLSALLAVGGTLAWFSDTGVKVNTVTMGSLDLAITEPGYDEWVKTDKTIIPGDIIVKDPHIANVNDVAAYTGIRITPDARLVDANVLKFHAPDMAEGEYVDLYELGKYWSTSGKKTTVDGKEYDIIAMPNDVCEYFIGGIMGMKQELESGREEMGEEAYAEALDYLKEIQASMIESCKHEEIWDAGFPVDDYGQETIEMTSRTAGGAPNNTLHNFDTYRTNSLDQDSIDRSLIIFVALDKKDGANDEILLFDEIKFDERNMSNNLNWLYNEYMNPDDKGASMPVNYSAMDINAGPSYEDWMLKPEDPQKTGLAISFVAAQMPHNEADSAFEGLINVLKDIAPDFEVDMLNNVDKIPESDHWTPYIIKPNN